MDIYQKPGCFDKFMTKIRNFLIKSYFSKKTNNDREAIFDRNTETQSANTRYSKNPY
jgi:hypothetical protein